MPPPAETTGRSEHEAKADSAVRHLGAHALLWIVTGLALAADLWTKHWAFAALSPDEARRGLFGLVTYQRSLNDGALFGMGKGLVPIFIIASLLAVGFILYFFAGSHHKQRLLHLALAFILAGALGNLYDRTFTHADRVVFKNQSGQTECVLGLLVSDPDGNEIRIASWPDGANPRIIHRDRLTEPPRSLGVVRDFIKIEPIAGRDIWRYVFNIADVLLVVGVAGLFISITIERRAAVKAQAAGLCID